MSPGQMNNLATTLRLDNSSLVKLGGNNQSQENIDTSSTLPHLLLLVRGELLCWVETVRLSVITAFQLSNTRPRHGPSTPGNIIIMCGYCSVPGYQCVKRILIGSQQHQSPRVSEGHESVVYLSSLTIVPSKSGYFDHNNNSSSATRVR